MGDKTFTTFDIAKILDITPITVAKWIDQGKLDAFLTLGGHRRVKKDSLLEFLEKNNLPVPPHLQRSGKPRILVIEDEPDVLDAVVSGLEVSGEYEVFSATDGFKAGNIMESVRPDIVVLDIMLPKIDGFRVCELIRDDYKQAKIIAITGYPTDENKKKIMKCGAHMFLRKPFNREELLNNIKSLLPRNG